MPKMMGIVGVGSQLQRLGNIKMGMKGAPQKNRSGSGTHRLPQKLSYYVVTTMARDKNDDWVRDDEIMEELGTDEPKSIPVFVPYDSIMAIMPHELAWWSASKLHCHGNGEEAERLDDATGEFEPFNGCKCPYYTGTGKEKLCKPAGILNVILGMGGRMGGVYQLRTSSMNSINNIVSSLAFLKARTGGPLAGIPLTLTIMKKKAQPKGMAMVDIYVAGLEFRADKNNSLTAFEQLQLVAGNQVQARLAAGQDMKQIEAASARDLAVSNVEDALDWEEEVNAHDDATEQKTTSKVGALRDRLANSESKTKDADFEDNPTEKPTEEELRENMRTEITTLLEDKLLPKKLVEDTTKWLESRRRLGTLTKTRDKLVVRINELEQAASADVEIKALRKEIEEMLDPDILPGATIEKMKTWLKQSNLTTELLKDGKQALHDIIESTNTAFPGNETPGSKPDEGAKGKATPADDDPPEDEAAPTNKSVNDLAKEILDLIGPAKEEGLVTESEYLTIWEQLDTLQGPDDLQKLLDTWAQNINDRRDVKGLDATQASE